MRDVNKSSSISPETLTMDNKHYPINMGLLVKFLNSKWHPKSGSGPHYKTGDAQVSWFSSVLTCRKVLTKVTEF